MIFCARATRGLRRPSLDARSRRSISPIPERKRASLEGALQLDGSLLWGHRDGPTYSSKSRMVLSIYLAIRKSVSEARSSCTTL